MMHGTFGAHRTFIFAKCEGMEFVTHRIHVGKYTIHGYYGELSEGVKNRKSPTNKKEEVSNEKRAPGCFGYIQGYTTIHYGVDYIPFWESIFNIQYTIESNNKFSWLTCINVRYQRSIFIDLAHKN